MVSTSLCLQRPLWLWATLTKLEERILELMQVDDNNNGITGDKGLP